MKKFLANLIYFLAGKEYDNVPYFLLNFVIEQRFDHYAGVSIYLSFRHNQFLRNLKKTYRIFRMIFTIGLLVIFLIPATLSSESFFYGVGQNLLADALIALLASSYVLPYFLDNSNKYKLVATPRKSETHLHIILENNGKKAFHPHEVKLRLFIPFASVQESLITENGQVYDSFDDKNMPGSVIDWINDVPIFSDDSIKVFTFPIPDENILYYKIFTAYGNFPSVEDSSQSVQGAGFDCIVGDIIVNSPENDPNYP